MMIEINLYKSAEFDDKKKLTEAMIQMIHETTKIEADNIYVISMNLIIGDLIKH